MTDVLSISFNQEGSCCSVGTESGFAIYNTEPFRETVRCNLAALLRCGWLCCGALSSPRLSPPVSSRFWRRRGRGGDAVQVQHPGSCWRRRFAQVPASKGATAASAKATQRDTTLRDATLTQSPRR